MRVFLAGEGPDDIGDWARHRAYRSNPPVAGVLEALVRRLIDRGWSVAGGMRWRSIRKYRAGDHRSGEERNVLGAALRAEELGCAVLVFARDRDRSAARERDIESGIELAGTHFTELRIAGGTANKELEAWLLALSGERDTEQLADAKTLLAARGVDSLQTKTEHVQLAHPAAVPDDAKSLQRWVSRVRTALGDS